MALELAVRELPALAPLCDAVGLRDAVAGARAGPGGADGRSRRLAAQHGDARRDGWPARPGAGRGGGRRLAGLVPGPHPADGLALPWGLVLRTADVSGTLRVTVGLPTPMQLGSLRVSGSAGLDLQPVRRRGAGVRRRARPHRSGGARLRSSAASTSGSGATVSAAARVPIGATTLTIPVLPLSGGLGWSRRGGQRALPIALDALTEVGTFGGLDVGAAVAALGDALDLPRRRPASTSSSWSCWLTAGLSPAAPRSCQPHRSRRRAPGCCSTRSCPARSAAPAPSSTSSSAPTSASTSTSPPACRPSASRPQRSTDRRAVGQR